MTTAYEKTLTALWRAHVAARRPNAPTCVSLFAGCGGSSLGYSAAGFREVLAVEQDETAVETFRLNFPGVPIWADDIARLSVDEALDIAGLKPRELDLLDFSPPCQGFSEAGEQRIDDPRSQLWRQAARLLDGMQPKHFIMENVEGLTKNKMRPVFDEMLEAFRKCGYEVVYALLNCASFGIPQARKRVIVHGVRRDLNVPPLLPSAGSQVLTVSDAWAGLPEIQWRVSPTGNLATLVSKIIPGSDGRHTNPKRSYFSTKRLDWKKPSCTVCAQVFSCGGLLLHPDLNKGISPSEVARIQSFPDEFQIVGCKWNERWRQLGNAVPPILAWRIGTRIDPEARAPGLAIQQMLKTAEDEQQLAA